MATQRSARDLGADDLVLSHFTLGRHHPIEDRVTAAAAAGFAGIGLYVGDLERLATEGVDQGALAGLLDEHGLCLADIEVLRGWAGGRDDPWEPVAWALADRFGCRYVQAIGPYAGTVADAARAFGALCDRAADHGLVVGLEPLPFTNIRTVADALAIVEEAGRPNGGLCVDIWHVVRAGTPFEVLRTIPGELVMAVQMSDGPRRQELDDYVDDCLRRRVPPGRGAMDAVGFVAALLAAGSAAPWSLEVCSDGVWGQPAGPHLQACADGMRAVLAAARAQRAGP